MKHLMFAVIAALICSCTPQSKQQTQENPETEMKTLVAYFSATGTTRKVADALAKSLDATLYEITPDTLYTAEDLDWTNPQSRSSLEMQTAECRPALGGDAIDVAQYDTVFIGFPIWWDLAPRQVNTFIEKNNLEGKVIIPFATSGSSTIDGSVKDLRRLYPNLKIEDGVLLNDGPTQAAEWADSLKNR